MTRLSLIIAILSLGGTCDSGPKPCKTDADCPSHDCRPDGTCGPQVVLDLSQYYGPDMAKPAAAKPTCVPPGTVQCGAGETFYSSPTVSGCFPTGMKPTNANPDPGYDNPSGPCPNTDNVIACDTPPTCSFCLAKTAAIPTGCYAM